MLKPNASKIALAMLAMIDDHLALTAALVVAATLIIEAAIFFM